MTSRYIAVTAALLFAATGLASAAEHHRHKHGTSEGHWRVVGHYVDRTCHCLSHPCGTTWTERGTLHRCVAAGSHRRRQVD